MVESRVSSYCPVEVAEAVDYVQLYHLWILNLQPKPIIRNRNWTIVPSPQSTTSRPPSLEQPANYIHLVPPLHNSRLGFPHLMGKFLFYDLNWLGLLLIH
ncbi:hypothetical protein O3M35_009651 [Rhynocoris fuscipes]|uniref:Uncharacterized protein n=1 Tax=Rhynocoris fuscipes TaxID=488301 RepID=A0AAW1D6M3_9HEMI